MKANAMLLGLVMLVLSGAVFLASWTFSPLPGQAYGSDTMPRAVGAFGLCVAVALLLQAAAAGERLPRLALSGWTRERRALTGLAAAAGAVIGYCLLSDLAGFVPTAFLILLGLMLLQRTPVLAALPLAAAATLAVQQIFGRLLLVPLPQSGLLSFLW
ncbi:tripartite tricarboxylate transporter TctB family protein [Mangrovicoccus sp. HB161399]|uniref:tripartite tricarboxylate transporter TctB family protein n=1 Tax=Mangrovicoccus sp. HB161399 TaxID=2720392 RepID=UPI001557B19C|nr:tripartite tricarboxylate transporter TctB family protein [Mangrovicoccus sp. HB161399]